MGYRAQRAKQFADSVTSLGGQAPAALTRFIRYIASSSSTLFLDLLILGVLTEIAEVFYLVSVIISYTLSNSVNYFVNRKWGFRETTTGVVKGYFLFLFFGFVGLGITVLLMWLFVGEFHFQYLFARVVVAIIEGTIGFVLNSFFTFKIPPVMGFNVVPVSGRAGKYLDFTR